MSLPSPPSPVLSEPDEPVFPLTLAGYHALVEAGVYSEDNPVEFLEGWLVPKMSRKPSHSSAVRKLREMIRELLAPGYFADSQDAVTTADSEPEPDVYIVRGSMKEYENRHPQPSETPLVVEVADATLARDRGTKQRVYARAGIPIYWIVNLVDRTIEVYSSPVSGGRSPSYREQRIHSATERVPVVVDGREIGSIAVADVLPQEASSSE